MSDTADFFRARLDQMVDSKHPLVALSKRLPWDAIEQALAPHFARKSRPGLKIATQDLLGEHAVEFGTGFSPAGRPRLPIRLMSSLQYLKNAFNLSDENGSSLE
jgi:transposase, IS5 family